MKRLIVLFLPLLLLVVSTGCSDDPASSDTGNGSMSAKVNGSGWSPTNVQTSYQSGVLSIGGSRINGGDNHQINIAGMVSGPGTYQLGLFSALTVSYSEGTSTGGISVTIFTATSGTVVIEELDDEGAKGTFSFEARDGSGQGTQSRSITEGTFDVTFD